MDRDLETRAVPSETHEVEDLEIDKHSETELEKVKEMYDVDYFSTSGILDKV